MGSNILWDLLKSTLIIWSIIFILINLLFLSQTMYALGLFSSILLGCIYWRLKPVKPENVERIFGVNLQNSQTSEDSLKYGAHRGAGLDAPENTLAAFNYCAENKCKMIELDVSLTSDGVPIVFHDQTLDRLAGDQSIVKNMTWKQLKEVDIAAKHPLKDRYPNSRIAQFDEAIDTCLKLGHKIIIDVKEDQFKIVDIIIEKFNKCPELISKAVVSGFNPVIIYMIRKRNSEIVCSMAYRPYFFSHASYDNIVGAEEPRSNNFFVMACLILIDQLWTILFPLIGYYIVGVSIVLLHKDIISREVLRQWQKKGVRVVAWTVNQPLEKQYFTKILRIPYLTDTLIGQNGIH